MRMIGAPLVYVGPTLSRDAVQHAYPGCIIRPPVRRGDLYRDRMLRGAVFVILDGVFFQDEAISPREILDVIADGALVVGASSMGALRAAECWPAGMRGVGSIYRLFQAGALSSDDEVAVAFSGEASSVALVNVRYAARQVVRARQLIPGEAIQLVHAAAEMFYEDRHWPLLLKAAGLADRPQLQAALSNHDLKATDAKRALARVRRWLRADPALLERPRSSTRAFSPSEAHRERGHDALACAVAANRERAAGPDLTRAPTGADLTNDTRLQLARWLFASGRYLRYADVLIAACDAQRQCSPRAPRAGRRAAASSLASSRERGAQASNPTGGMLADERVALIQCAYESADAALAEHAVANTAQTRAAYVAVASRELRGRALLRDFAVNPSAYLEIVWLTLGLSDELDAELFRYHAQSTAAARALAASTRPSPLDRHAAELGIATTHGFASWTALIETLAECAAAKALVAEHCDRSMFARSTVRSHGAPRD
ncbi:MAG TPA: TfuA-like protein [Polyangiales bacterium]|nr:TfuA-like protein [Polyangiales bacterium]